MQVDVSVNNLNALIDAAKTEIAAADTLMAIDALRVRFLGKKGIVTAQLKLLSELPVSQRRDTGLHINQAKGEIAALITARRAALEREGLSAALTGQTVDVTLPGRGQSLGSRHPITCTMERIEQIFNAAGFDAVEGPEVEDDFHNFEALNFTPGHPARAMQDTFYLKTGKLLRTHTSPVQVRVMLERKPPLRVIAPGRVYRCDSDLTHTPMFHQVEGLLVDKNVSMSHLKSMLVDFVRAFLSKP